MNEFSRFPHLDPSGGAWMVDITGKDVTVRWALARAVVRTDADLTETLVAEPGQLDPLEAARVAAVQAAKRTSTLVPLCHPIQLTDIRVEVIVGTKRVDIAVATQVVERTGVEMEALTGCAAAGLTIVAALAHAGSPASLDELTLWVKDGGRSGRFERHDTSPERNR